ncbi:hypothetical protein TWF694_011292 [Orbilia ellipsospora]|uniref:Nephrocystin 3-like N-terminal domain-containing protein n=1 Tax=Orbilia ellipsospora TaxID=2528407 RepID=A0AAV9X4U2_9PEZI
MSKRKWKEEDGRNIRCGMSARVLPQDSYTIGWICALPLEMAAARVMLDDIHPDIPNCSKDQNGYIFGSISSHYVVIACLPSGVYGTTPAALVASQMRSSFPSIQYFLMVGIGGGVPTTADIRLGDIVVGIPTGRYPGVVQYDRGKTVAGGRFEETGTLNKPPRELLNMVSKLRAIHLTGRNQLLALLADAVGKLPAGATTFSRPEQEDILFQTEYDHIGGDTCGLCSAHKIVIRPTRQTRDPVVHYGLIASGNQVMKDGTTRDLIAQKLGAYCFEMEAAGLMDVIECLVIRGICDYSDSHKNKQWQEYAAATAAAYSKELLLEMPASAKPFAARGCFEDRARGSYVNKFSEDYETRILRSLSFADMDSRRHNIASAHENTCDWIFETEQFQQWRHRNNIEIFNGVLWIKGKPGAGKSTLMKHILRHCQASFPNHSIAAYFFNARGTLLEKSRCGLLRSLLYQLLEKDPKTRGRFIPHFMDKEKKHGYSWEWCESELESFLKELIPSLDRPVLLLVDALDECDQSEVRKVVSFLEGLSSAAVGVSKCSLSICLSSRHYPTISMRKMLDLVVEKRWEHDRDITTYVQDKLRMKDKDIESELLQKAAGVFMWIVLVVEMLNQAYDNGNIHAAQRKLREVPSDLDEVFHILLGKDNPDKSHSILMLLLLLFAKERLRPEEFYYAVLSGSDPKSLGRRESSIVTDQIIERFITSGSRGLIEVRNVGHTKSVQFIHETVNDFLLRNKRLQTLDSELSPHIAKIAHQRIVSCCLAYIEMGVRTIGPPQKSSSKMREYFDANYPFLRYAVQYIFDHAEQASCVGVGQEGFLQYLQHNPKVFQLLKAAHNICACDITEEGMYESEEPGLLYILSVRRCPKLVRILLRDPSIDINARGGYHVTALQAAVAATTYREDTSEEIIQVLLDAGADVDGSGGLFFNALQAAVAPQYWAGKHRNYHKTAAIASMLIGAGADVNTRGGFFGNALQAAAAAAAGAVDWPVGFGDISEVIQVLLDAGADVNAQGGEYGSVLQAAAASRVCDRFCYHDGEPSVEKVIKMLLDAGANVNMQGGFYGNALQAAAASAAHEGMFSEPEALCGIVEMLLKAGANVNAQGGFYGNALQAAVAHTDRFAPPIKTITMLLEAGADVNAQGGYYKNAVDAAFTTGCEHLQNAGFCASSKVLELLLSAGAVGAAEAKQNLDKYDRWVSANINLYQDDDMDSPDGLPSYDSYEDVELPSHSSDSDET